MSGLLDHKIAFIGFGEAASAFVKGWDVNAMITAYDIKCDHEDEAVRQAKKADYATSKVTGCPTLNAAVEDADVIFSMVTPDQAAVVAQQSSNCVSKGAYFFDCNRE